MLNICGEMNIMIVFFYIRSAQALATIKIKKLLRNKVLEETLGFRPSLSIALDARLELGLETTAEHRLKVIYMQIIHIMTYVHINMHTSLEKQPKCI